MTTAIIADDHEIVRRGLRIILETDGACRVVGEASDGLMAVQIIEKKAGPRGSLIAVAADHGMPGEPPSGRRRITTMEIVEAVNKRFSPTPPSIVQYFTDAANAQMHLDTKRMTELGFSLKDVAAFLESQFFAAAFTEDEVRDAQIPMLPAPSSAGQAPSTVRRPDGVRA